MVRSARNHPSIVLWSIGNEIPVLSADPMCTLIAVAVQMRFTKTGANLAVPYFHKCVSSGSSLLV